MEQEKKNQNQPAAQEVSVGDQIKVRREKLASLQAEGRLSLIHISEPTRQAEISYAVFCLKKKKLTPS